MLDSQFAAIERWEPRVHALVDFDRSAAQRNASATGAGPLAGWSVGVKDIVDLKGIPTRCNADFIPWQPAARNAVVVDRLLEAGACVIAKTVTTTFAYMDPGPTRNPWHLDHTPGGSSSGSAAAVACGMCRVAIGTQTVGSINRPASYCGVVGFKPTCGWLAVDGIFPFSPTVDTVGFFTADVGDMRTLFTAIYTDHQLQTAGGPLRVGVVGDMLCEPPDASMRGAMRTAANRLAEAGHHVSEVALPEGARRTHAHHWTLVRAEAAQVHRALFQKHAGQYTPKLRVLIDEGLQVSKEQLDEIGAHRRETMAQIDRLCEPFDVLLTPSAPGGAPRTLQITGDPRMNLLWTYVGTPALTLPAGLDSHGLPLGIQLIGRRDRDHLLLAAASVIEQAVGFQARPTFEQGAN